MQVSCIRVLFDRSVYVVSVGRNELFLADSRGRSMYGNGSLLAIEHATGGFFRAEDRSGVDGCG